MAMGRAEESNLGKGENGSFHMLRRACGNPKVPARGAPATSEHSCRPCHENPDGYTRQDFHNRSQGSNGEGDIRQNTHLSGECHFFDRFLRIPFTDGLIFLSVRWIQPIQQHGRRMPLTILDRAFSIRIFRVSSFFASSTQQIHSLRASGVMSSQIVNSLGSDASVFRRSAGRRCTVPEEIV